MTPTQRSLKMLRDAGYTVAITEHWNPFANIRQDLYGFIDLLAIAPRNSVLAVQTTSGANVAKRISKILSIPAAKVWLETGSIIVVHGWRKLKPRGTKVPKWHCLERYVTLDMFTEKAVGAYSGVPAEVGTPS